MKVSTRGSVTIKTEPNAIFVKEIINSKIRKLLTQTLFGKHQYLTFSISILIQLQISPNQTKLAIITIKEK